MQQLLGLLPIVVMLAIFYALIFYTRKEKKKKNMKRC